MSEKAWQSGNKLKAERQQILCLKCQRIIGFQGLTCKADASTVEHPSGLWSENFLPLRKMIDVHMNEYLRPHGWYSKRLLLSLARHMQRWFFPHGKSHCKRSCSVSTTPNLFSIGVLQQKFLECSAPGSWRVAHLIPGMDAGTMFQYQLGCVHITHLRGKVERPVAILVRDKETRCKA